MSRRETAQNMLQKQLDELMDKKQELTNEIALYEEDDTTYGQQELEEVEAEIGRVTEQMGKLENQDED